METIKEEPEILKTTETELGHGIVHHGGRHMRMFRDRNGNWWLCNDDADPQKDPKKQGCWSCDQIIFTRGG